MMKNILIVIIIIIQGCSQNLGALSVISTKELDMGAYYVKVADNVRGMGTIHIIVFLPTRFTPITIEEIVNDALYKTGGDLMTNCLISSFMFYIPYIYGQEKIIIEGDVWKKQTSDFGGLDINEIIKENNLFVFDNNELKPIETVELIDEIKTE